MILPSNTRTIVEEPPFQVQVKTLKIDYKRLDEAMQSLTMALSRKPKSFPCVDGTRIRRARISESLGVPEANIWFTYSESEVHLITIELLNS